MDTRETDRQIDREADKFWKDIIYRKDGKLNVSQVKRELRDFYYIMKQVPEVYCSVTGGLLSKLMYPASVVISAYEDDLNKIVDDSLQQAVKVLREVLSKYDIPKTRVDSIVEYFCDVICMEEKKSPEQLIEKD